MHYCDRTLQLLLQTFFDIIRLRKGPEDVPDAPLVLVVAFALLLLSTFSSSILIDSDAGDSVVMSFVTSVLGYVFYTFVLAITGFARRFTQTIACIMACGSILSILMVFAVIMLGPFIGGRFASIVAALILFWSVPVKGHIIARAIDKHWYLGIVIAMTIFVLQYVIYSTLTAQA